MLPAECDSEYRVYRGDYFCGRSHFVCCALQQSSYNFYNGFDLSLQDSGVITDENAHHDTGDTKTKSRKKREKEKQHRKNKREKRKKQIRKEVQRIVREVERILNKAYRNGSVIRKKKSKALHKYVKYMKKKFRKDRDIMKQLNEDLLFRLDEILLKRIQQVQEVNVNFMENSTFRNIILTGMMTPKAGRMLSVAYPELKPYLGLDATRRSGAATGKEYLDYDVEYGLLFS